MQPPRRRRFRRRLSRPVPIGQIVDQKARRWRLMQRLQKLEVIRAHWPDAAGSFVAAHVAPVRLVRRQLRLASDDAGWVAEMAYLMPSILERLKQVLPGDWVDELKIVPDEPMPPAASPGRTIALEPPNQELARRAEETVAEVADPELAAAILRARLMHLRRRPT